MRYLLDTHTFLWGCDDSHKLSETAREIIDDERQFKYLSIATLWEFSIKYSMGKLSFQGGLPRLFEIITHYGLTVLPINEVYLHTLIELPFTHRDPFDRLLVATAKADGLTILTKDENIPKYDVLTVW